jgi:hypothetical protein
LNYALAKAALVTTFVALILTLVGNVVEFGIWGKGPFDSQDPGAAIFFSGLYLLMLGLGILVAAGVYTLWRHVHRAA